MAQIKVIFWDIDGTLLNFEVAEESAIRKGFAAFGLGPCSDAMLAEYSTINRTYWQRLERGEITKQAVLEGRFQEFFSLHGLDPVSYTHLQSCHAGTWTYRPCSLPRQL